MFKNLVCLFFLSVGPLFRESIPENVLVGIQKHLEQNNWKGMYYDVLHKVIQSHKYKNVVEIGVALGGHAEEILTKTNVHYFGVDPYRVYDDAFVSDVSQYSDYSPKENLDYLFQWVNEVRLAPFKQRYQIIRKPSVEAAQEFRDNSLDCVFIDGDHSTAGVLEDLAAWFPKVKPGHLILGDDYWMESVAVAVESFFAKEKKEVFFFNSDSGYKIWAVYK